MNLRAMIVAEAQKLGLDPAADLPLEDCADDRLAEWLDQGFAGSMAYMARYQAQRENPAAHFEPYKTVVAFRVPYAQDPPQESKQIGNIARYALGDDYHEVIKAKIFKLLDRLRAQIPGFEGRAMVDTAPLLEKVVAERCGLGWQGKHSNLITQGRGSYYFLAEMLINQELEAQEIEPAKNRCGTCVACIDVCPTAAIVAPYVVDARRCISYLTIENRGPIPVEFRSPIGHRIFGCDDCQEVCPWNRLAEIEVPSEFEPRPALRQLSLVDWFQMSLEDWRRHFKKSAVKRAKFEGFRRNVAVALGNSDDAQAIPVLTRALSDESALVRGHVVWALAKLSGEECHGQLKNCRQVETDPFVIEEIDRALAS